MKCRFCSTELKYEFIDLVNSPASNSFLTKEDINNPELYYPLKLYICHNCLLVQIDEYKKHSEIFSNEYAYFSSYSTSWLKHCKTFVDGIIPLLQLNSNSFVIEIASNDGYLLQNFREKGIPCLGIEPTVNTAKVAQEKGINTLVEFFNNNTAEVINKEYQKADLIIGNNVIAHDPNLNEFVASLKKILQPEGIITIEIPHIYQLILNNQFDTIYHEHFSYFSLHTHLKLFDFHRLEIYHVEEIPTHGGSLRLYIKHKEDISKEIDKSIEHIVEKEEKSNLHTVEGYLKFQENVNRVKYKFMQFLLEEKQKGALIAGYGAAAKGNTLLNYCGIKEDIISFIADKSPFKQGRYTPGSHIPIVNEEEITRQKPEYVIILPWNIKDEIMEQLNYIKKWGSKFVIPIPKLEIL